MPSLRSMLEASNFGFVVLVLVMSYILIGSIVNYFKLRQFQGPPLAGFSRLWLFWHAVNGRFEKAQSAAVEKYGSVCRIGPDLLITNDVDILRHINAPRSKWRRSGWYDAMKFDPRLDSVFSTRDEKLHTELKAKEAGGYQGRDIDTLENDIDNRTIEFIQLINNTYNNTSMDFGLVARYYVLDVLSTVAYGAPFGFMAANEDLWKFTAVITQFQAANELSGNHRFFHRILTSSFVRALLHPKVTDKIGVGPAMAFARNKVAERFGPNAKVKKDLLGHFVSKGLSQQQCEVEAMLQIMAGSDSTTTIIRCIIFTLAGNPAASGKLRAEIDAAYEAGSLSRPVIKFTEAQNLPYLHACIWEGFRMFPPLFGLKSKLAPPGGETVKGVFFPGGTEVAGSDDAVCRRKDIFGEDSHIYRPERWLEADAETRLTYERTVNLIFGSGRFLCLGRHIAMMELYKAIAELMRCFDWSITDPMKGVPSYAHGVHIQSDMNMVARAR